VGGLGHTSAVALAQNIFQKKRVICIDGDGSFIMHLGSLIHCGNLSNHRFKYIIFDNKSHESVGNIALNFKINYKKFSSSVGFKNFIEINKNTNIEKKLDLFFESKLNTFMLVKIANGTFKKLFRIKELHDIKTKFITD
jgi:phosphonopyruvate decarboxylase